MTAVKQPTIDDLTRFVGKVVKLKVKTNESVRITIGVLGSVERHEYNGPRHAHMGDENVSIVANLDGARIVWDTTKKFKVTIEEFEFPKPETDEKWEEAVERLKAQLTRVAGDEPETIRAAFSGQPPKLKAGVPVLHEIRLTPTQIAIETVGKFYSLGDESAIKGIENLLNARALNAQEILGLIEAAAEAGIEEGSKR